MDLTGAIWHKNSRSSGNFGICVEVADDLPGIVAVRDNRDRHGPALIFGRPAWSSLVDSIKTGLEG